MDPRRVPPAAHTTHHRLTDPQAPSRRDYPILNPPRNPAVTTNPPPPSFHGTQAGSPPALLPERIPGAPHLRGPTNPGRPPDPGRPHLCETPNLLPPSANHGSRRRKFSSGVLVRPRHHGTGFQIGASGSFYAVLWVLGLGRDGPRVAQGDDLVVPFVKVIRTRRGRGGSGLQSQGCPGVCRPTTAGTRGMPPCPLHPPRHERTITKHPKQPTIPQLPEAYEPPNPRYNTPRYKPSLT